jgi:predicted Zn-dependent protease with MMP-like domain
MSRPSISPGKLPDHGAAVNRNGLPPSPVRVQRRTMWITAKAPSLAELEQMANQMFATLPDEFRALCEDVIIRVDDFATDEVLDELGAESEFDVLGLFQGLGLPQRSSQDVAPMPNMIWLYRRPILDYWADHDDSLGEIVRHVLVHEIGHHFGLSDADMEAIEAQAED